MIDDASTIQPAHGGDVPAKKNDLILAFDASCGTCSLIASLTAEICGDRFSVLSLSHPRVARLRYETLGPEAPWTPTLLDPGAIPPRAWTGKSLALRLAALIGPRKSWRVLKAIGTIRQEGRMVEPNDGAPQISRARFLGGIPLAASGATLLLATPSQASTTGSALRVTATPSNSISTRQLTGERLLNNAMSTLENPDVQNILDRGLAAQLRAGTRIDESGYQNDLGLIRYADAGSTELSPESSIGGACALIRSGEHAIGTNKASVTGYVFPRESYALTHESYEREFDGVRSRARLWTIPELPDGEFTLAGISINGSIPELLPSEALTTPASSPPVQCGGCTIDGDWSEERVRGTECAGGAFYDCARSLGPCAACITQCAVWGPACVGCLVTLCPFAYVECCGGRVPTCYGCDIQ